jgi:uncharacterized protein (TIGR00369 family)
MTDADHFRKLEAMYHGANCNRAYGPRLTVSGGKTELVIPVREDFFHAAGAVHGAVYFKALDDAAFFACNSLVRDVIVLTVSFHVLFMRPVSSGEIRAEGRVIQASERLILAESGVCDDQGREIARGTGCFVRSEIRLTEELGYR